MTVTIYEYIRTIMVNHTVMKSKPTIRLLITIVIFSLTLIFLENKRRNHRNRHNMHGKDFNKANNITTSNNDYIFFESLSKYLFISALQ